MKRQFYSFVSRLVICALIFSTISGITYASTSVSSYSELASAISSGRQSIVMTSDITVGSGQTLEIGGSINLDTGSYKLLANSGTIIIKGSAKIHGSGARIVVAKSGTVKVQGGSIYSDATTDENGNVALRAENGGSVIVSGGTVTNEIYRAVVSNGEGSSVIISNGTITGKTALLVEKSATATVSGGTLYSQDYRGIAVLDAGAATISGGTITSGDNALRVEGSGIATVTGGKFSSLGTVGTWTTVARSGGTITFRGGNIESTATGTKGVVAKDTGSKVNIYDGTYINCSAGAADIYEGSYANIYGGTLSSQGNGESPYVVYGRDGSFVNISGGKIYSYASGSRGVAAKGPVVLSGKAVVLGVAFGKSIADTSTGSIYDFRGIHFTAALSSGKLSISKSEDTQDLILSTGSTFDPLNAKNATIRYTTDNTTPTAQSAAYSSPISVGSSATVKVVAERDGYLGQVHTYQIANGAVTLQTDVSQGTVPSEAFTNGGAWTEATVYKFNTDFTPKTFRGNTVVSMIPVNSALSSVLQSAVQVLKQSPAAQNYYFLPPESYHVTILEGVTEVSRNLSGTWTSLVASDSTLEVADSAMQSAFNNYDATSGIPSSIGFSYNTISDASVLSVRLTPNDAPSLLLLRKNLRTALGTSETNSELANYNFHITVAYKLKTNSLVDSTNFGYTKYEVNTWLQNQFSAMGGYSASKPKFVMFNNMCEFKTTRN